MEKISLKLCFRSDKYMFGVLLDKKQLEKYMEKLASDHNLKNSSDERTYPIPNLIKDFEYITMVYNLLNEHIKLYRNAPLVTHKAIPPHQEIGQIKK